MTNPTNERLERIREFLTGNGLDVDASGLVEQSLVHRSYAFEHEEMPDNERLEFLGDAVLGCLASEFLYHHFPLDPEGLLSKKKAFLVSRKELGRRAEEMGLSNLVLLGRGEEHSGGRDRISITGSALEALIAALYFTVPFPDVRSFVWNKVLQPGLDALRTDAYLDYKSRLQELVQKSTQTVPVYRKIREVGPAHSRSFVVEVLVEDRALGSGEGMRIKTAENRAARQAYERLLREKEDNPK